MVVGKDVTIVVGTDVTIVVGTALVWVEVLQVVHRLAEILANEE